MGNTKKNKPIGVFDSGIGGLSVLRELRRLLPKENFIFLADQLYVPYGEKSKKELINLGYRVMDYFLKHHKVKMVVVACNTSTCSTIDALRARYYLPIVGTVPAVKPAAENTRSKVIGVVSTPSTSESQVLSDLIKDNCQGIKVLNIGCRNLENVVEEGDLNGKEAKELLKKYLKRIKNSKADQLVLGCTHYPFLKSSIQKIVGPKVKLIDGNKAIAMQTKSLLQNHILESSSRKFGKALYFTTGDPVKFSKIASSLLKKPIKSSRIAI